MAADYPFSAKSSVTRRLIEVTYRFEKLLYTWYRQMRWAEQNGIDKEKLGGLVVSSKIRVFGECYELAAADRLTDERRFLSELVSHVVPDQPAGTEAIFLGVEADIDTAVERNG